MKATNIKWDVDEQDLTEEVLNHATEKEIAELLGTETHKIHNINKNDLYELVLDALHRDRKLAYDYLGLPTTVDIPESVAKEDVADWLSNEYEYLHDGFELN